jgi:hypothetical protein
MGMLLDRAGMRIEAEEQLRAALAAFPQDPLYREALVSFLEADGRSVEARAVEAAGSPEPGLEQWPTGESSSSTGKVPVYLRIKPQ